MKTKIHAVSATIAFLMILIFFGSTIIVEFGGDQASIGVVKRFIVYGLFLLVPSMMAAGITGNMITPQNKSRIVRNKLKRLKVIIPIGILILIPCAIILDKMATSGNFGELFVGIQALELLAGGVNISLLGMNMRDGFKLSGRFKRNKTGSFIYNQWD